MFTEHQVYKISIKLVPLPRTKFINYIKVVAPIENHVYKFTSVWLKRYLNLWKFMNLNSFINLPRKTLFYHWEYRVKILITLYSQWRELFSRALATCPNRIATKVLSYKLKIIFFDDRLFIVQYLSKWLVSYFGRLVSIKIEL